MIQQTADPVAKTKPRKLNLKRIAIWVVVVTVSLSLWWFIGCYAYATAFETRITVTKTTIKQLDGSSDQTYLVATNAGSFKIEDTWLHWQRKSFDLWSSLTEGKTYNIKAYGWRSGLFSSFPNIYEVKEVQE